MQGINKKRLIIYSIVIAMLICTIAIRVLFADSPEDRLGDSKEYYNSRVGLADDEDLSRLLTEGSDRDKTAAIVELKRRMPDDLNDQLKLMLKDESSNVKATAISCLSTANKGDLRDVIDELVPLLNDKSDVVRERAKDAIQNYIGFRFKFDVGKKSEEKERMEAIKFVTQKLENHGDHIAAFYEERLESLQ